MNQAMDDRFAALAPTFVIEEGEAKQVYEFVLNDEGEPIKLGDGTFGVVYKARRGEKDMAVKLLYSEPVDIRSKGATLTAAIRESFRETFQLRKNDKIINELQELEDSYDSIMDFMFALRKLELDEMQFRFLAEQCQQATDSSVKSRYEYERESADTIIRTLREANFSESFTGVIEIEAGTTEFRLSNAYLRLNNKFSEAQINISDYAIVMPLYKYTLKDLLERRTGNYNIHSSMIREFVSRTGYPITQLQSLANRIFPDREKLIEEINSTLEFNKIREELLKNIHELNGYDLLRAMSYKERISTMLPYLMHMSQGLMALHLAGKFHYDLKPANIFVREAGGQVQSVIGDLGFFMVQEQQARATHDTRVRDALPLGTRHFRSPEQKDYFDICDVEIDEAGDLNIRDPKFEDTIIEIGDYVVFSKDSTREKHFIKDIEQHDDWRRIILVKSNAPEKKLQKDERTQAVFYKQQKVRTDLFGFGAIVFDMLTGGKSPERFYDKIRSFDKDDQDVDQVMDSYRQVANYLVSDPGLIHIFSDFKNEAKADYAPDDMVELILKCMLYKAKNTYYRSYAENYGTQKEYHNAMGIIFQNLLTLNEKKYQAKLFQNPLINKTFQGGLDSGQSNFLETKIYELQKPDPSSHPLRLARGIWYFRKLIDLLVETLENQESRYFLEIRPKNIVVERDRLNFLFTAYQKENNYKQDLRQDLVYARITRDITDPFVPNYLTFMRRRIQLKPIKGQKNLFGYQFIGSTLLGDSLEKGDWIIINSELCKIISVDTENHTLNLQYDEEQLKGAEIKASSEDAPEKESEHTYYKNLDPCKYYLYMLGIYLYHIFFVGLKNATRDKPLLITIAENARHLSDLHEPVSISDIEHNENNHSLQDVYRFVAHMYLKLIFSNHSKSYYKMGENDKHRILTVSNDSRKLQTMIANYLGILPAMLDRLIPGFGPKEQEHLKTKLPEHFPDELEFDTLIRTFIDINLDKRKHRFARFVQVMQEETLKVIGKLSKFMVRIVEKIMQKVKSSESSQKKLEKM